MSLLLSLSVPVFFFFRIDRIHVGISLDEIEHYRYYSPDAEVVAVERLIHQMGCNVIAKHTDRTLVIFCHIVAFESIE